MGNSIAKGIEEKLNVKFGSERINVFLKEDFDKSRNVCKFFIIKKINNDSLNFEYIISTLDKHEYDSRVLKDFEFHLYELHDKNAELVISTWINNYLKN